MVGVAFVSKEELPVEVNDRENTLETSRLETRSGSVMNRHGNPSRLLGDHTCGSQSQPLAHEVTCNQLSPWPSA
jgi:hypothetical protein